MGFEKEKKPERLVKEKDIGEIIKENPQWFDIETKVKDEIVKTYLESSFQTNDPVAIEQVKDILSCIEKRETLFDFGTLLHEKSVGHI